MLFWSLEHTKLRAFAHVFPSTWNISSSLLPVAVSSHPKSKLKHHVSEAFLDRCIFILDLLITNIVKMTLLPKALVAQLVKNPPAMQLTWV